MKHVLWFTVVAAVGLYICGPLQDPDLWWHITVGRWILAHGEVPVTEHWNMFALGKPWLAYSWSNEILFAWLDAVFGDRGLIAAKAVLAIGISLSFCYCLGSVARDWLFGLLIGVVVTAGCFNHFTLRPQSFVWIFLIWSLLWADRIQRDGFSTRGVVALVLLFSLWANTHITTALGLMAVGLWSLDAREPARAFWIGLVCLLGTLLTPYLGAEWLIFFGKTTHPFEHGAIAEFQPAHILQYSTGFAVFLLFFLLSLLHVQPPRAFSPRLLLAALFMLGGLTVVKFLPFAVIVLGMLVAARWREAGSKGDAFGNLGEGIERLRALLERLPREGLAFVFICMSVVNFMGVWREPIGEAVTPVTALDFVIEKKLSHPLLNDFGKGGYVMYRLSDAAGVLEHPVSIEGRTNVVPPPVWEKFMAAFRGKREWREYLDLVQPETILWRTESPLSTILLERDEWCAVFRSGEELKGYLVFVQRSLFDERTDLVAENCQRHGAPPSQDPLA